MFVAVKKNPYLSWSLILISSDYHKNHILENNVAVHKSSDLKKKKKHTKKINLFKKNIKILK